MWHVSLSYRGTLKLEKPSEEYLNQLAEKVARKLLEGVGTGEWIWEKPRFIWHLRRSLSESEIAGLPAEWLAIEPVDMG